MKKQEIEGAGRNKIVFNCDSDFAISILSDEDRLKMYDYIFNFMFSGELPSSFDKEDKRIVALFRAIHIQTLKDTAEYEELIKQEHRRVKK